MDIDFRVVFEGFNRGLAPLAHIDTKTYIGDAGQAAEMKADIVSFPGFLTQSPGLSSLENGTQAGVVDQLIRFILEQPINSTTTYAIGTSKLFKLSATAVASGGSPSWPQTISGMTEGESIVRLNANVFAFYNKSSGGDILAMPISTEVINATWGSVTDMALEKAPHPVAVKEDIMIFGNGRYVGTFIEGLATLDVRKLDLGEGAEVADIVFHAGFWWIAVNYGDRRSQIIMYDGSALSNILSDETSAGTQKIGFLYIHNGVTYVTYSDSTSGGYSIGYISGRTIKSLRYFPGSLPTHRQKTLYKNTISFISGADIYSFGASVEQLPAQISKLADAGYANVGAIAAPFGTPLVASSDGSSNHRIAKFSGLSVDSNWKSIVVDISSDKKVGMVHTIIVYTKALEEGALASIQLLGNQGALQSTALNITGVGKTRHIFTNTNLKPSEDIQVLIDYAGGSTTKNCPIRKVVLLGNYVES